MSNITGGLQIPPDDKFEKGDILNSEHILICEDDEACMLSLSFVLESDGYAISKASDGKAALETICRANDENMPFDLLITDINMPELNGLELIKSIRDSGSNMPVIVMTGYGDRKMLKELIQAGCDDFLDKPFELMELRGKVTEVLEKQKRIRETYERAHDDILKKHRDMSRETEAYKMRFESLKKEFDLAVVTYNDLISMKDEGYNIAIAYYAKPLSRLGGDYADLCNTSSGCDILIADVAGHDLAASYHTVLIKAFFDENCRTGADGETFFHLLNHALLDNGRNERMVTALFLRLNLNTMRGELISAGHPRVIRLARKMPIAIPIHSEGPVLGLCKDISFEKTEFSLDPGDRLFLYTDGIINAYYIDGPTGKKHTLYEDGLDDLISKYAELPLNLLVDRVWNKILAFCRHKPSDDMLLFGLEIPA